MAFFRRDGSISTVVGQALAGVDVYVCSQPANVSAIPPSPLVDLYAAADSNTVNVTGASWELGILELTLASIPSDLVVNSFIRVIGSNPAAFNGIYEVQDIDGLVVTVALATDPGTYVGSAQVQTSALSNPLQTDGLGNYFFYADPGEYTIVYVDPQQQIPTQTFEDQGVTSPGAGTVTSVTLTMPAEFTVTPGTSPNVAIAVAKAVQNANKVYAGPASGADAAPTFRDLVLADLPAALGTVTSVGLTVEVPSFLSVLVTGSPVTTAGVIDAAITQNNQGPNLFLAGPISGAAAQPTYRAIDPADLPGSLSKATVTLATADILALLGTPFTLVPAPGAGFTIQPIAVVVEVIGGSASFTDAGGDLSLVLGSASQAFANTNVFTTPLSNKMIQRIGSFSALDTAAATPSDVNASLQLSKVTNNFAAGNGSAQITVYYFVVPIA